MFENPLGCREALGILVSLFHLTEEILS